MALAGCAQSPATGSVTVEIPSFPAGATMNIRVQVLDAAGHAAVDTHVEAGTTERFDGIPLGKVRIVVEGFCDEETTLSAEGVTAEVSPDGSCSI